MWVVFIVSCIPPTKIFFQKALYPALKMINGIINLVSSKDHSQEAPSELMSLSNTLQRSNERRAPSLGREPELPWDPHGSTNIQHLRYAYNRINNTGGVLRRRLPARRNLELQDSLFYSGYLWSEIYSPVILGGTLSLLLNTEVESHWRWKPSRGAGKRNSTGTSWGLLLAGWFPCEPRILSVNSGWSRRREVRVASNRLDWGMLDTPILSRLRRFRIISRYTSM